MSSTQTANAHGILVPTATVDLKIEVVPLPVSDVDRAKCFYEGLGWCQDADFATNLQGETASASAPFEPVVRDIMFTRQPS